MARWALIAEEDGTTRTRCARAVATQLVRAGYRVGGFVQLRRDDGDECSKVFLERLATGEELLLASRGPGTQVLPDGTTGCHAFSTDAFVVARTWLLEDARHCEVLVLDAISKLETLGRGHAEALRHALGLGREKILLVCARASLLFEIVETFGLLDAEDLLVAHLEAPLDEPSTQHFARTLEAAIHRTG